MGVSISTMRSAVRCREFTALDCRCQASRAGRQVRWTGPRRGIRRGRPPVVCPEDSRVRPLHHRPNPPRRAVGFGNSWPRRAPPRSRRTPRSSRSVSSSSTTSGSVGCPAASTSSSRGRVLLRRLAAAGAESGGRLDPVPVVRRSCGGCCRRSFSCWRRWWRFTVTMHPATQWVRHRAAGDGVVDVPAELAPRRQASDYLAADPSVSPLQHLWSISVQGSSIWLRSSSCSGSRGCSAHVASRFADRSRCCSVFSRSPR